MTKRRLPVFKALTTALLDAPRWVRVGVGVAAVVFGSACVARPFLSLAAVAVVAAVVAAGLVVAAVTDVVRARRHPPLGVSGPVLLAAAVAAVLAPGPVLSVLSVVVPLVLIGLAAAAVARGLRRGGTGGPDRVRTFLGGAATAVAGVLALLWPDLAEYVLAQLFGLATVLTGLWLIVSRSRTRPWTRRVHRHGRRWRWPARVASGLALAAALVLLVTSIVVVRAAPGFSVTPPAALPAGPGGLVSAERLTSGLPTGVQGWRILYTTERADGSPTLASGLVAVGGDPGVARPVVAWAHGTTGYTGACGPSTLPDPLVGGAAGSGAVLTAALSQGAALVATDYPGLGTPGPQPYLVGRGEGRAVLDAVRAARGVPGLALRNQVLIWGHSQGGHAALWAGALAPTYAPDVTVVGVTAAAPATDLPAVAAGFDAVPGEGVFLAYLLRAYADTYPDVQLGGLLRPGAEVAVRAMAGRCLTEPAAVASLASSALLGPLLARPLDGTAFAARLRENVPAVRIAAPVLIVQGATDTLVPAATQAGFVRRLCATATTVDYRTYAGLDHTGIVTPGSPALPVLVDWSRDRLMGVPAGSTC